MTLIAFISDTHGFHDAIKIPDNVDILVHSGDSTIHGKIEEMKSFIRWFGKQKPKHKIFINGNHEVQVSKIGNLTRILVDEYNQTYLTNIHYLEEDSVKVEGLKFWGSPYTPEFFDWAYMYMREDGEGRWAGIPDDTDIIITHGPAYGIRDDVKPFGPYQFKNAGCKFLLEKIQEVKPLIHVYGHIHSGAGYSEIRPTLFINASICDESYNTTNPVTLVTIENKQIIKIEQV